MPRKAKRKPRPTPVKAEVYSVLTIGVPSGKAGVLATTRAVEELRKQGFGAGVLAEAIGPEATLAIRDLINQTAAAVKAEIAGMNEQGAEQT